MTTRKPTTPSPNGASPPTPQANDPLGASLQPNSYADPGAIARLAAELYGQLQKLPQSGPTSPAVPTTPHAPGMSGAPHRFGLPVSPSAPHPPSMAAAPSAPHVPAVPGSPHMPPSSGASSLPGLPSAGAVSGAPAIPGAAQFATGSSTDFYFLPSREAGQTGAPSSGAESFSGSTGWDVHAVRRDFPILQQKVNGKPLIWLDNAATSQKPVQVIEAVDRYYREINSNVHRGAHTLAARSTDAFEAGREKVQRFLGAASPREIIFVRNATEAINLVAQTFGRKYIGAGDEIVLTRLEHHANIVPWQMLAQETGARLRVAPLNERGEVILEEYERLLNPRTRLVALAHVSNALGTVLPVCPMVAMARRYNARVLVDGAQSVPHFRVNVQALDADFYVFSGHKLFAPTGIGALYGKLALLEEMPPWQGGGSMIENVTFEETTYNKVPYKFEAGTNHIAGAVGLGAAIDYLNSIGFEAAAAYEAMLTEYATHVLAMVPGLRQIGTSPTKVGVLSFVIDGISNERIGQRLNEEGIAVRAGHHCAQPALRHFGLDSTVRPSLAFYNTPQEIDALAATLHKIVRTE